MRRSTGTTMPLRFIQVNESLADVSFFQRALFPLVLLGASCLPSWALAATSLVDEPGEASYRFVSYHSVAIDAPVDVVWTQLLDLKSWMYEFELATVSGERGQVGEVLRLYEGQAFMIQLIALVPNEVLVMANLPSTFQGETSTGIGVMSLYRQEGQTIVELTMSRRYTWMGEGVNEQRKTRESETFVQGVEEMWRGRFLARLRCLAERNCGSPLGN